MKIDRLIGITMHLLGHQTVSATALAQRFEVSRRTIQRDIEALCQAGIPIVSTYGAQGGYAVMDGFKITKQIAGLEDHLNIIIALKALRSAYASPQIDATLDKVLASMYGSQSHILVDFAAAREGTHVNQHLRVIDRAIRRKEPLDILYANAQGDITERVVEPLLLSCQWYSWYLLAFCTVRQEYRLFKLPRMLQCKPVAGVFIREHAGAEDLLHQALASDSREYHTIRLRCKAPSRQQILEYLGGHIETEYGNGDFILAMRLPMERMWFSLLMGFGNQIEVLEPEVIRAALQQRAHEIIQNDQ